MYVDAHCHLDLPAFDADRPEVIERARAAGVTGFLVAGVDPDGWRRQRALSAAVPGVRWTAGLHPWSAARLEDVEPALVGLAACFEGVHPASGVGETGLDSHFVPAGTLDRQADCMRRHLALARDLGCPLVLHVVKAHGRALEILRPFAPLRGMVHAFSGGVDIARAYLGLGLHLSFAGPVARPDARRLRAAAAMVPSDRLLLETDAPDQSPPLEPRRNEPAKLRRVADAVADVRNEPPDDLLRRSAQQVAALFGPFGAPEGEPWTA